MAVQFSGMMTSTVELPSRGMTTATLAACATATELASELGTQPS
jgi:hypothetical protein